MVLEVVILHIVKGRSEAFEKQFALAAELINCQQGYISHSLKKCMEEDDKYLLQVEWETLEDHQKGFRKSNEYQEWKKQLHHFYEPFPTVEHYQ